MDIIFKPDELRLVTIRNLNEWDTEKLLGSEGIFYLKDVVQITGTKRDVFMRHIKAFQAKDESWEVMGVRKIWNHWAVRMTVFAPYYREHISTSIKTISKDWDGNRLLKEKGQFFLTDVCDHLPFSQHQIRYQAKRNPNAREEYGVWKDEDLNRFVVEMEIFGPWIRSLWNGKWN